MSTPQSSVYSTTRFSNQTTCSGGGWDKRQAVCLQPAEGSKVHTWNHEALKCHCAPFFQTMTIEQNWKWSWCTSYGKRWKQQHSEDRVLSIRRFLPLSSLTTRSTQWSQRLPLLKKASPCSLLRGHLLQNKSCVLVTRGQCSQLMLILNKDLMAKPHMHEKTNSFSSSSRAVC